MQCFQHAELIQMPQHDNNVLLHFNSITYLSLLSLLYILHYLSILSQL